MMKQKHQNVIIFPDPTALAEAAADRFVALAGEAVAKNGRFACALSGGSTPTAMQQLLAAAPRRDQVDWARVHLFWGDERFVPPDHAERTLRQARETLLDHVPIPPDNIHTIVTNGTPVAAAAQYEQTIRTFFDPNPSRFDLIFLGMGDDGHTASLFPDRGRKTEDGEIGPSSVPGLRSLVTAVTNAPKPPPTRITFTPRLINRAAQIIFLVTGSDKAETVTAVLNGPFDPSRYPAQAIKPEQGQLTWLLDEAAAELIHTAK
jgi:6-phosphogluconolactonase